MAQINLNIKKSVFLPCYQPYVNDYDSRYNVYYGGRGSGKTIFVFQKLLLKGLKEKRTILLMRKTTANCKFSVWKELKEAVERFQLTKYFTFYESDYSAVCNINGTVFKCTGLDVAEKIKGFSEVSDVLLEEATEFTPEDFDLIDGTVRSVKYDLPLQIYCLFNPVSKANWVYKRFGFEDGIIPPDTFILKTTYLDNPHLSPDYIKRMENMKLTNPTRWKIEALGDFVSLDKLIFQNWKSEEFNHAEIKGDLLVGMDFGFVNDVSTVVASVIVEADKRIYVFKEWGDTNKTNEELAQIITALGFSKSVIVADSAEQKSIEEIRRKGVAKIKPCVKGADSIIHGIQKLQNYEIIIHPSCTELLVELENYAWTKDKKTGEYINKPIDAFNHYIDALRYSLQCVDNSKKLKTMSKANFSL
jgi:phage terminase large subunit